MQRLMIEYMSIGQTAREDITWFMPEEPSYILYLSSPFQALEQRQVKEKLGMTADDISLLDNPHPIISLNQGMKAAIRVYADGGT